MDDICFFDMHVGTTVHTEFAYNATGDRIRIRELTNGTEVVRDDRLIWDGADLLAVTDAHGSEPARRFFGNGMAAGANLYLFTRDHLGSIREVVTADSDRTLVARYDYDPYGQRTVLTEPVGTDYRLSLGYAGYYYHAASGLCLTKYRAYDAVTGRWLSRDPIEEEAGINLYAYVDNGPLFDVDPLGLYNKFLWDLAAAPWISLLGWGMQFLSGLPLGLPKIL